MRCSSFESRFDEYLDGTLAPHESARVAAHAKACRRCAETLHELRIVDALLLQPRRLEPAPNFTFKAMAEIRALRAPRAHHHLGFSVLATYTAFAWAAIALAFTFRGDLARAAVAVVMLSLRRGADALAVLASSVSHLFGGHTTDVTAAVGGILVLDVAAAAIAIVAYTVVRPRLATHLASTSEFP